MAGAEIPGLKLGHSADEQSLLKELHAAMADGGIKMSNEDIAAAGTEKSLNPRGYISRAKSCRSSERRIRRRRAKKRFLRQYKCSRN